MTEDIYKVIVTTNEDEAESELVIDEDLNSKVVNLLNSKRNLEGFILEVEKVQWINQM